VKGQCIQYANIGVHVFLKNLDAAEHSMIVADDDAGAAGDHAGCCG
jgi:hypothetical protein